MTNLVFQNALKKGNNNRRVSKTTTNDDIFEKQLNLIFNKKLRRHTLIDRVINESNCAFKSIPNLAEIDSPPSATTTNSDEIEVVSSSTCTTSSSIQPSRFSLHHSRPITESKLNLSTSELSINHQQTTTTTINSILNYKHKLKLEKYQKSKLKKEIY